MPRLDDGAMTSSRNLFQRARLCLLLFALIAGVYLLSFRAVMQSGDTLRAFDAITSYAHYGDWLLDESAWTALPLRIRQSDNLPLREYDVEERLQTKLALPLLQMAQSLPRLGNIHAVWLFNVIVTALIVALIFLLARALGYDDATSLLVALSSGLATNLWAYSQALFREPLAALFILLALLCLQIGRRRIWPLRLLGWLCAAGALLLAAQVKLSAALALPAVLVFAPARTGGGIQLAGQALQSAIGYPADGAGSHDAAGSAAWRAARPASWHGAGWRICGHRFAQLSLQSGRGHLGHFAGRAVGSRWLPAADSAGTRAIANDRCVAGGGLYAGACALGGQALVRRSELSARAS